MRRRKAFSIGRFQDRKSFLADELVKCVLPQLFVGCCADSDWSPLQNEAIVNKNRLVQRLVAHQAIVRDG